MSSFLDKNGLSHLWSGLKTKLANKQDKITSTNKIPYSYISGTPTIPTVNNATLTIQKNGTDVQTFTANSSSNKTANITVPTKTSDLTNDSGYTTNTGTITGIKMNGASKGTSGVVDLGTVITSHQDISGKAPTSHASSATTYGVGTSSSYGHCKTINNLTSSSYGNGYALSAYQGYVLNQKINDLNTSINQIINNMKTYNFIGWLEATYANGAGFRVRIPIFNPTGNEPTLNITNCRYFDSTGTWVTLSLPTISRYNKQEVLLYWNNVGGIITVGNVYLIDITGSIKCD